MRDMGKMVIDVEREERKEAKRKKIEVVRWIYHGVCESGYISITKCWHKKLTPQNRNTAF
jgi:hypothetical protein